MCCKFIVPLNIGKIYNKLRKRPHVISAFHSTKTLKNTLSSPRVLLLTIFSGNQSAAWRGRCWTALSYCEYARILMQILCVFSCTLLFGLRMFLCTLLFNCAFYQDTTEVSCIALFTALEDLIHEHLECRCGSMKTKRHHNELEQPRRCLECHVWARGLPQRNLPASLAQVRSADGLLSPWLSFHEVFHEGVELISRITGGSTWSLAWVHPPLMTQVTPRLDPNLQWPSMLADAAFETADQCALEADVLSLTGRPTSEPSVTWGLCWSWEKKMMPQSKSVSRYLFSKEHKSREKIQK